MSEGSSLCTGTTLPPPYYDDGQVVLYHADARDIVGRLPPRSVDICITSPPYYAKRNYTADKREIGRRDGGFDQYIADLVEVLAPLSSVLAVDGNLFVVIGYSREKNTTRLLLSPEVLAMALEEHGFILKDRIIWYKFTGSPESVRTRLRSRTEAILRLVVSSKSYFDVDRITLGYSPSTVSRLQAALGRDLTQTKYSDDKLTEGLANIPGRWSRYLQWVESEPDHPVLPGWDVSVKVPVLPGQNPGDFWLQIDDDIGTGTLAMGSVSSRNNSIAPFPPALVSVLLSIGCRPGGIVLDPFVGGGTTCWVAKRMGFSRAIGVDIDGASLAYAAERCSQLSML